MNIYFPPKSWMNQNQEQQTLFMSPALCHPLVKTTKTRQEICLEYEMSYKVFQRKLAHFEIALPSGVITPKHQIMIYEAFGPPPSFFFSEEKGK